MRHLVFVGWLFVLWIILFSALNLFFKFVIGDVNLISTITGATIGLLFSVFHIYDSIYNN